MLVECKWANRPVGVDVLRDLERKAGLVGEELGSRREDILLFGLSRVVNGDVR